MTGRMFLPKLILPWAKTSELSENSRLHWKKKYPLVKKQKRDTAAIAMEAGWHKVSIPDGAIIEISYTFCPPSNVSTFDDDNAETAQKGARDALAGVLGVDDSRFKVVSKERGDKSKHGGVIVVAEVVRDFPDKGDNFRTIGFLSQEIVKNAARKQQQLPSGQFDATKGKNNGDY